MIAISSAKEEKKQKSKITENIQQDYTITHLEKFEIPHQINRKEKILFQETKIFKYIKTVLSCLKAKPNQTKQIPEFFYYGHRYNIASSAEFLKSG